MPCARCDSDKQAELVSEIAIHFSGPENLDKPHVFVFPKVRVCLVCGSSEFQVAETELRQLREGLKRSTAA